MGNGRVYLDGYGCMCVHNVDGWEGEWLIGWKEGWKDW